LPTVFFGSNFLGRSGVLDARSSTTMTSRTLSFEPSLSHEDLTVEPGCIADLGFNEIRTADRCPLSPISSLQPPSREMSMHDGRCNSVAFTTPT